MTSKATMANVDVDFVNELVNDGASDDAISRLTNDEKAVYVKLMREKDMAGKKVSKKTVSKKKAVSKKKTSAKAAVATKTESNDEIKTKGRKIDKNSRRQQSLAYFIKHYGVKSNAEIKQWMSELGYTKNARNTIFYSFVKMKKDGDI